MIRPILFALALGLSTGAHAEGAETATVPGARQMTPAQVSATLRADPTIYGGLFAAAMAVGIRDICPSIEDRPLRSRFFLLDLYSRARSLGFSHRQVADFVENQAEVDRMYAEVIAHVRAQGVDETDVEAVCRYGRAQIAAGTQAGSLLRQR